MPRGHPRGKKIAPCWGYLGGEGGIRTLGPFARTPDFESGTFDHSATSPVSVEPAILAEALDAFQARSTPNPPR
jgi:hypothetical protein